MVFVLMGATYAFAGWHASSLDDSAWRHLQGDTYLTMCEERSSASGARSRHSSRPSSRTELSSRGPRPRRSRSRRSARQAEHSHSPGQRAYGYATSEGYLGTLETSSPRRRTAPQRCQLPRPRFAQRRRRTSLPWARNLKSYENVTSISSVGMVTERKRPKVLITFALSAAERAMCPGMWAAPLAPRSARELLLFAHPRAGTPDDVLRPRFRCHMRELGASTTFCAARLALFS